MVHCGGRRSVVQQPLIRAGAATAACRAGATAEGDPGVGGGVLMGVGGAFTPGLLLVVVAPSIECLRTVTQPGASVAGPFVAGGLLGYHGRAVDVVILEVGRPDLVNVVDGKWLLLLLQVIIGPPALH